MINLCLGWEASQSRVICASVIFWFWTSSSSSSSKQRSVCYACTGWSNLISLSVYRLLWHSKCRTPDVLINDFYCIVTQFSPCSEWRLNPTIFFGEANIFFLIIYIKSELHLLFETKRKASINLIFRNMNNIDWDFLAYDLYRFHCCLRSLPMLLVCVIHVHVCINIIRTFCLYFFKI